MANDPATTDVWMCRHDGEKEGKACRKVFNSAVANVSQSVRQKQEQLGQLIYDLYQASIDFGAHPNTRSVFGHASVEDAEEHWLLNFACLYHESDSRIQQGLVACAENGIASTFVIALAAKSHPLIDAEYSALAAIYERVQATLVELGVVVPPNYIAVWVGYFPVSAIVSRSRRLMS